METLEINRKTKSVSLVNLLLGIILLDLIYQTYLLMKIEQNTSTPPPPPPEGSQIKPPKPS